MNQKNKPSKELSVCKKIMVISYFVPAVWIVGCVSACGGNGGDWTGLVGFAEGIPDKANDVARILPNVFSKVQATGVADFAKAYLSDCSNRIMYIGASVDAGYGDGKLAPSMGPEPNVNDVIHVLCIGIDAHKLRVVGNVRPPPALTNFILEDQFKGLLYYEINLNSCDEPDAVKLRALMQKIINCSTATWEDGPETMDGARLYLLRTVRRGKAKTTVAMNCPIDNLLEFRSQIECKLCAIAELFTASWDVATRDTRVPK